jgi:hypothetical protein
LVGVWGWGMGPKPQSPRDMIFGFKHDTNN